MKLVAEALDTIKAYLDMAVMPLTHLQLEVLRYKPPQGQSQTLTKQTVIQIFCKANLHDVNPDQLMKVVLLNTIQTKDMMTKVQERLEEHDT